MTALVISYDDDGAARVELGEIADTGSPSAAALPFVQPLPDAIQRRVQQLLERNSAGLITADERRELDAYVDAGLEAAARALDAAP